MNSRHKSFQTIYSTMANLYALLWWIRRTEAGYYAYVVGHYAPPLYGVSTTVMRICSLSCIALMKCLVRGVRMFEEMLSETGFYKRYTPFENSFAVD